LVSPPVLMICEAEHALDSRTAIATMAATICFIIRLSASVVVLIPQNRLILTRIAVRAIARRASDALGRLSVALAFF
jgi:hypothetical protein